VHTELLPLGQTVNQHIYRDVLQHLMRSMRGKRQQMYKKSWLLHHDNALNIW